MRTGYINIYIQTLKNLDMSTENSNPKQPCTIDGVNHFYSLGDIVPYKNTRGNRKYAVITEFKQIERNKKWWFYGVDTSTHAKVFYPEHLSRALANCG